jgi:hypothetical protein
MTTFEQQQIDNLLARLSREELLTLIERIAQQLRQTDERTPLPLYGIWKDTFPEAVDIDKDLQEIRTQWTEESEELKNGE